MHQNVYRNNMSYYLQENQKKKRKNMQENFFCLTKIHKFNNIQK